MSAMLEHAEAELARVLEAPASGRSHSARVSELAEQRAAGGRPAGLEVKEAAAVDVVPGATAQAQGTFVALISDFDRDRTDERFDRRAFDGALQKVRKRGRAIPVAFGHDLASVHSVLGHVPPDGFWTDDTGLWARGHIDVSDPIGTEDLQDDQGRLAVVEHWLSTGEGCAGPAASPSRPPRCSRPRAGR